jgi:hypothetical protein
MLAVYFEIERVPPEAAIFFGPGTPTIGLFKRQIFKQAVGMERRQSLRHAVLVLGRQMAVDDCSSALSMSAHLQYAQDN